MAVTILSVVVALVCLTTPASDAGEAASSVAEQAVAQEATDDERTNVAFATDANADTSKTVVSTAEVAPASGVAATADVAYDEQAVLVQVREGASADEVEAALREAGCLVVRTPTSEELASGLMKVGLAPGASVAVALDALAADADGALASAQPDYAYQVLDAAGTADDLRGAIDASLDDGATLAVSSADAQDVASSGETLVGTLSTSVNDPRSLSQWGLSSVRAYEAWDAARAASPASGAAVTVAVLDAGFDISHEDLAANVVAPYNAHTGGTSAAALSGLRHGTHVAGIVAAVADNAVGVAGVSYNAHVMPIKVTDEAGVAYTSDLVRAYSYLMTRARSYNVRVVNISMGGAGVALRSDDALLRKVDQAYAAGIVTVAAAGNSSSSATVPYDCYPADYPTVVSVMNLCQNGSGVALAASSNRNAAGETDKNIAAPGTSILSTLPDGSYGALSGTSMASPHVAAVVALEFAADPTLTADEAKEILYASARDLGTPGFDATYGYGEVDAAAAVAAVRKRADEARAAEEARQAAEAQRKADEEAARKAEELAARKAAAEAARQAEEARAAEEAARKAAEEARRQLSSVRSLIAALPDASAVTLADRAQVEAARAAYDALDETLRASVDVTRLLDAERRVAQLDEEAARKAAEEARQSEAQRKAAEEVRQAQESWLQTDSARRLIAALPSYAKVTLAHKELVGQARAAYDALSDVQRRSVSVTRLVVAEQRIAQLEEQARLREQVPTLTYDTRSQLLGWMHQATNGATSGLAGNSVLSGLNAVRLSMSGQPTSGSLQYRAYVQGVGWQSWASNNAISGTSSSLRGISALQVKLTGKLAENFDVCYRTYSRGTGWTGWTRNGLVAGRATTSEVFRLQAVQAKVVAKGDAI